MLCSGRQRIPHASAVANVRCHAFACLFCFACVLSFCPGQFLLVVACVFYTFCVCVLTFCTPATLFLRGSSFRSFFFNSGVVGGATPSARASTSTGSGTTRQGDRAASGPRANAGWKHATQRRATTCRCWKSERSGRESGGGRRIVFSFFFFGLMSPYVRICRIALYTRRGVFVCVPFFGLMNAELLYTKKGEFWVLSGLFLYFRPPAEVAGLQALACLVVVIAVFVRTGGLHFIGLDCALWCDCVGVAKLVWPYWCGHVCVDACLITCFALQPDVPDDIVGVWRGLHRCRFPTCNVDWRRLTIAVACCVFFTRAKRFPCDTSYVSDAYPTVAPRC